MDMIRFHTELFYDVQKLRIMTTNRLGQLERDGFNPEEAAATQNWLDERLVGVEKEIGKIAAKYVKREEIWLEWLKDVKGIGPTLAACLISWLKVFFETDGLVCQECGNVATRDLDTHQGRHPEKCPACGEKKLLYRFAHVSSLWRYCGMSVNPETGEAPRKQKGQRVDWNPRLRTLCWKIGEQFVKAKGFYRDEYDRAKALYRTKYPEKVDSGRKNKSGGVIWKYTDGHIHMMAKRKAVKLFLSHLFVKWYEIQGLTPPRPFVIERMGQGMSEYIHPNVVIGKAVPEQRTTV
jgi:hypothetical protein